MGAGSATSGAGAAARKVVLVVDDDAVLRDLVRVVVEDEFGASAVGARTVPDALAALRAVAVDLVVLDLRLPGEGGDALLRRLAQEPPGRAVPVVVLTAVSDHLDARDRALALGAAGFVRKPFELDEVAAALAPWLRAPVPREQ